MIAYYADTNVYATRCEPRHLVLEDGTVFRGRSVGAPGVAAGEACFTTAMAGYEEAVTDPSYVAQVLCFSYPLDRQLRRRRARAWSPSRVQCEGVVMRRARPAWAAWLREQGVVALDDVDTRALVRRIRDGGALRCALGDGRSEELLARALAEPPIDGRAARRAPRRARASRTPSARGRGSRSSTSAASARSRAGSPTPGLEVVVVPGDWDADAILETRAARRCWSATGPATLRVLTDAIETVRDLLGRVPALRHLPRPPAARARARPRDVQAAVRPPRRQPSGARSALGPRARHRPEPRLRRRAPTTPLVTHVSLNDGTVEGLAGDGFSTVQFHPEAAPGPLDALPFFDRIADACRSARIFASILIVGSGPIRIGQACEFDYSGAQACRVLRREGYRVVLVNSNPATIMTDPEWADATYLEPLDAETRRARSSSASGRTRCCRRSAARRRSTSRSSSRRRACSSGTASS